MIDVELLGTHPDGNQLILNDNEGKRYILTITEDLRDAVKIPLSTQSMELNDMDSSQASPKNIQILIRQGKTAEEVAKQFNIDVKRVKRHEGPILAERQYMAEKAQECPVGRGTDSPKLGELAVDRLAARGVDPLSLQWDAIRHGKGPWEIILTFVQGATEQQAHWRLDSSSNSISAIDEEAAWLSESKAPGSSEKGGATVEELYPNVEEERDIIVRDFRTDNILEELNSIRGLRHAQSSFNDEEDEIDEFNAAIRGQDNPTQKKDSQLPANHRATVIPLSRATGTKDEDFSPLPSSKAAKEQADVGELEAHHSPLEDTETALPGLEAIIPEKTTAPAPKKTRHKTRQSIPTWDEIVFGAKPR